uniref:Uncharacterized protein n=1 Tax=Bionectria ochroleuca TaxID=29856 RepID=A0A8H7NEM9_BIOOC
MANQDGVYGTFIVSSGCVCFGSLHNIWGGSLAPVQPFRQVKPQPSGTVSAHEFKHNIAAVNGTWNVFQLKDLRSGQASGWFACHVDVDPDREIEKILTISGSPYEDNHGSTMNNDTTFANGVFVINRYDWGYYAREFLEEIGEGVSEGDADMLADSNSAGLADYAQAQAKVQEWQRYKPSKRRISDGGVWMYSPDAEYMFGRFGFNEARTEALSFLFFSTNTEFSHTVITGRGETLRPENNLDT